MSEVLALGDVADVVAGVGFPKDMQGGQVGAIPVFKVGDISAAWLQGKSLLNDSRNYLSVEEAKSLGKCVAAGATVFAKIGEALRLNRRVMLGRDALVDNNVMGLVPKREKVAPKYLYYFMQTVDLGELSRSTTVPSIRKSDVVEISIPVPALVAQDEIVAELEKQFSRLDEAVANLQRVKANLKRYKASVLKAAVEGRLVETEATLARREGRPYESAQALIAKTPTPPRPNRFNSRTGDVILGHGALAVGIPPTQVPEGWQWVNLVEIAKMETGHTPSRGHPEWWDGDVPWIGIADARDHHERSILKTIQYTNSEGLANSAARLLPAGTVCVSRTASVGYVVVMGKAMATSQDFVNWVPTIAVTSDWLRVVFTADRDALIRFGKGSVHKTIYFPEWLSASIALPPLAEQARIVAEVDRHLSIIREVEVEVDANLKRAQALRQATLSKQFRM